MTTSELRQRRNDVNKDESKPRATREMSHRPPAMSGCTNACLILLTIVLSTAVSLIIIDIVIESKIDPEEFTLADPPEFVGPLAPNTVLSKAERLFENQVRGPESLTMHKGMLYTGTADGKVMRVNEGRLELVASLGVPPCGRFEDEPTCGRPLGMRFDHEGFLIVIDTYLGLFKVNVDTGHVTKLYSSSEEVAGKRPMFLNDLDIASDGSIYISDSSTKWDRRHNRLGIYENRPDGRLLKFDPKTNTMSLLAEGFYLANGVQLSPNEDFVLVSESTRCRIKRYHLTGAKAGTIDVFSDNLPGIPDNVRPSSSGGYWVGLAVARLPGRMEWRGFDLLAPRPWLRRVLSKILSQDLMVRVLGRSYGLIVELDQQGQIISSLHDPNGHVIPASSEIEEHQGILYIGSYFSPFIGKLDMR